jgi:hypothetical protein
MVGWIDRADRIAVEWIGGVRQVVELENDLKYQWIK